VTDWLDRKFWFADHPDEEDADDQNRDMWQPFVQLSGMCLPLPVWFDTEEDCRAFIRDEIIGTPLEERP
jgi:hypothetical protein